MKWRRLFSIFMVCLIFSYALFALTLYFCFELGWLAPFQWTWQDLPLGLAFLLLPSFLAFVLALCLYSLIFRDEDLLLHYLDQLSQGNIHQLDRLNLKENLYLSPNLLARLDCLKATIQSGRLERQNLHLQLDQASTGKSEADIIQAERQRVARELHDSVSQELFAMTMLLATLDQVSDQQTGPEADLRQKLANLAQNAQNELRALLLHLRPIALEKRSLAQGIQHLFDELEGKLAIHFVTRFDVGDLDKEIENNLFRIVQELLSNSLRHAQATEIECQLFTRRDRLYLVFRDNGRGFKQGADQRGGYGLQHIRERVDQLAGELQIISQEGQGTQVRIQIALDQDRKRTT
ncbi:sensor histidine kinase [Aerococcus sanguinicola]|uniref:histidine kinase n=1 Tax=Aerococcus sanguinicola TaxID=119206 RepID=A0A0X8F9R5_9LACT|nr:MULTISPECIES: sensor histidine kinase [Aerococcus]AMB93391.1 hypothetical protein AWM72_00715 [Aerococcus sanguinicola]MDK7049774.1 sensor histidine kinase [Aerococcus sanguinicola]OFT92274.1 hypothetical protein HMPREF3090_09125 [Aerococcus sp. HMSC23C02]PKZ23000.1 sensor histidine kinase [Aerococcus sanguinicola]